MTKPRIACVALAVAIVAMFIGALCACSQGGGADSPEEEASEKTAEAPEAPRPKVAQQKEAPPEFDFSAVDLEQITSVLEYSDKSVDPLTLVKIVYDGKETVVASTKDEIDLHAVGEQSITYDLEYDGQSAARELEFTVRDTRGPEISFTEADRVVEQYADWGDPASYIASVVDPVDGELSFVYEEPEAFAGADGISETAAGNAVFYDEGWYMTDGNVDTSTPGMYPITVTAVDIHGNVTTKTLEITVKEAEPVEAVAAPAESAGQQYVLNTNTMKFHHPYCKSVSQMKEKNKQEVYATRDEVISWGYVPCKNCNP